MTREPLVTIFTPCYNHEKYLDEYFRGLLAQTYSNVQLILIDDSSTDGSWRKVQEYEPLLRRKFPLVVLERHAHIGSSQEFLLYFDQIQGEFLSILESDDYYLPTKVEENVRYLLEHDDVGAVHSEVDFIYGKRIERRHWQKTGRRVASGDVFDALLVDNFIMTCTFLCRTALFRRHCDMRDYLVRGYVARDYALFLDLARHTQIGYIPKSLARYRVLRNSFSHSADPERAFLIQQDAQQVKLDYIERYGGSERARELAIEGRQESLFLYGFKMREIERCLQAYDWLLRHNPRRYGAPPFRVLALAVRNRSAWQLVSWIKSAPLVREAALRLFSLRNRGQPAQ
jgi:glycosyltransferase involved in cell wall biosynthesis